MLGALRILVTSSGHSRLYSQIKSPVTALMACTKSLGFGKYITPR